MQATGSRTVWTCHRCLRLQQRRALVVANSATPLRSFTTTTPLRLADDPVAKDGTKAQHEQGSGNSEPGAMSRRLSEMAEETMDTGSKSDRKLMKDVGFSEQLKKQLEERIAQTAFETGNQQAISMANIPTSAGKGTQDIAAAQPWSGSESLHDASLRMLDDSHKRIRSPTRAPRIPQPVSLRPAPKQNQSVGNRLANARDKTSIYASSKENPMTDQEREAFRKELKDRFQPGHRPMPTSLQGLTSLANERIEDAIARGQFKNIPRGKGKNIERDYTANSPFLNTTEYFMNKIIQKQEIVPPWIEKQQELVKLANGFRSRLRNDWRRHAARSISSAGGSVEDQVRRAKGFALAEEMVNPRVTRSSTLSAIGSDGTLTSITVEQQIAAGVNMNDLKSPDEPQVTITVTEKSVDEEPSTPVVAITDNVTATNTSTETSSETSTTSSPQPNPSMTAPAEDKPTPTTSRTTVLPMPYPFRDPAWEAIENTYQKLAIEELNSLTRSYNLMAPKLAQKPYYNLQRELNRCFADVAPLLPDEILERSKKPVVKIQVIGHKEGGVMERFGEGKGNLHTGIIRDEAEGKGYGFKQLWRDLFRKDEKDNKRTAAA